VAVAVGLRCRGRVAARAFFKGETAGLESGDDLLPGADGNEDIVAEVGGDEEDADASQGQRSRQLQHALAGIKALAIDLHDDVVIRSD